MNINTIKQICTLTSNLSKDTTTKVGAVLYKNSQVLSIGYNGMPRGFKDDKLSYSRDKNQAIENSYKNKKENGLSDGGFEFFKYDIFEHAERNIIFNFLKSNLNTEDLICLTSTFPSVEDGRALITSGVKTVVVYGKLDEIKKSHKTPIKEHNTETVFKMFKMANIEIVFVSEDKIEAILRVKQDKTPHYRTLIQSFTKSNKNNEQSSLFFKFKKFLFNFNPLFVEQSIKAVKENPKEEQKISEVSKTNGLNNTSTITLKNGNGITNNQKQDGEVKNQKQETVKEFCAFIKKDFNVLDIQTEEDVIECKAKGLQTSAIRKSLFNIASRYIDRDIGICVTMQPCIHCLSAIALSGIKYIKLAGNSVNENTNKAKWNEEIATKEYQNILKEYAIVID